MRLNVVTGWPFRVKCIECQRDTVAGDQPKSMQEAIERRTPVFADPDGESFKAYYCRECAAKHDAVDMFTGFKINFNEVKQ